MTVVQGTLTMTLHGQEATAYRAGSLLSIPRHTRMQARNLRPAPLELIVIKASDAAGALRPCCLRFTPRAPARSPVRMCSALPPAVTFRGAGPALLPPPIAPAV